MGLARRRRRLRVEPLESRRVLAAIVSGQELTDSIAIGQSETFEFSLDQTGPIRLAVGQDSGATGSPRVLVRNSVDEVIAGPSIGADGVMLELLDQPAGDYTAVVTDLDNNEAMDFRIRLLSLPGTPQVIEGRDSVSLGNGQQLASRFDFGSFNFHTYTLDQTSTVRIGVGQELGSPGTPELTIYDASGNIAASATGGPDAAAVRLVNQTPGTYTVVVAAANNNAALDYHIRMLSLPGTPSPIAGRDSALLENGEQVSAAVDVGSFNFHRLNVDEASIVRLAVGQDQDATGEPELTLYRPDGRIAAGPVHAADGVTSLLAHLDAGTYTAIVEDRSNNAPMDYRIRLLMLPGTPQTLLGRDSQDLGNGREISSRVDLGSFHFHNFTVNATSRVRLMVGQDAGQDGQPEVTIYAADGTVVHQATSGADTVRVDLDELAAGTYTVVLADLENDAALDYRLRLLAFPGSPELVEDRERELTSGLLVESTKPAGTLALFPFTATVGDDVMVDVIKSASTPDGSPRLEILDASGTLLEFDAGADGASDRFTAAETGTYYAVVTDDANAQSLDFSIMATGNTTPPVVTVGFVSVNQGSTENFGSFSVTVGMSAASTEEVTIPITLGGTATLDADYVLSSPASTMSLTIPAGSTDVTFLVMIEDDTEVEPTETVVITLDEPTGATLGTVTQYTVTIIDNDEPSVPTISVDSGAQSVNENVGTATFDIVLSQPVTTGPVTVPFVVSGTATDGSDFLITASPIAIPAGQTRVTVTIAISDDAEVEAVPETIVVTLGEPTGAALGSSNVHTVSILDNDGVLPEVNVSPESQSDDEGVGALAFNITLSSMSEVPVLIPFTLSGTATLGVDYDFVANPLVIPAGAMSITAMINVIDDNLDEGDEESVVITLSEPTGAVLGDDRVHTATIIDNDGTVPTVAFESDGQSVDESVGSFTFDVVLSSAAESDVTIPFTLGGAATVGEELTSGVDFTIPPSPITIPAGSSSTTLTVTVSDDTFDEDNERIIVTLGTPNGANLGAIQVYTVIITDNDDSTPVVNIASAEQSVDEDAGTASFDVNLSVALSDPTTVPFALTGTAENGVDYIFTTGSLTIPAGVLTLNAIVSIIDDTVDEPPEMIVVTLESPDIAQLGPSNVHTITINDNDEPAVVPVVNVDSASQSVSEDGGAVDFDVILSEATTRDIAVPFALSGTADDGSDYSITGSPVTILAGETSATVTVNVTDDAIDEDDETLVVTLQVPTSATLGTAVVHTVTIQDNDAAPLPVVVVNTVAQTAAEDAGTIGLDVVLSSAAQEPVTVPFVVGGTATDGVDYGITLSPITIPAGETTATVTIDITDDSLDENAESLTVTLQAPTGATLGSPIVHTVTIADNDEPSIPMMNIGQASQSGAEGLGVFSFTITLSEASTNLVSVPLLISGTATPGSDYAISASPINFAAGATVATVTITITDDLLVEGSETAIISLGTPTAAILGPNITHTLTIEDNDEVPPSATVDVVSQDVSEDGGTISFNVILSSESSRNLVIPYTIAGTATDVADFAIQASPLVIESGATSGMVSITIADDTIDEADETIVVTLGTSAGVILGNQIVHTATIIDNDEPLPDVIVASAIPAGASDEGIDGQGPPPTTWSRQRSSLRVAEFDLGSALAQPPTPADLVLTNRGVNGLEAGTVVPLRAEQIATSDDRTRITLSFDAGQLPDGVYELVIGANATGGEPRVISGSRENGFFVLAGDYNGSGVVDNRDFTTFAYWFLSESPPPEYVDLRTPVGVNAQDFAVFLDQFGISLFPEIAETAASTSQPEGESLGVLPPANQPDREDDTSFVDQVMANDAFLGELF